ncbi:MAG: carboxypeptidase regulatory-like domain-containing protein [Pyrinomonadaceae bacterium]
MSANTLFWIKNAFWAFLIIAATSTAFGQTVSGTLRGTITDTNGAVVPNATVVVRSTETGLERTVTSSDDGVYNFAFLPIGTYMVVASRTDFNRVIRESVTVSLNETTVINIRLDPTVSGEVTVTSEAAPINTSDGQIAQSLSASQILERPVANQGNFLTLAETFTGYQENPTGGQNNPTASSGSSINFNGTGTRGATFQINGVNNDDSSENQNRQGASLATIKEFQVITNNFTAEFGRGYGAVVLVQTLSGTNSIKGSAYWFHNDQALNAKSFFSHGAKPVFRRNQFGGVGGFPIFRDKFFAFLSVDEVRHSGANLYQRDLPTAFERNPANWFALAPANDTPSNRAFIQNIMDRFDGLTPNDPANRSRRTFVGVQPFNFPANDYSVRLDWNATQKDTLWARWQYTRQIFAAADIIPGERADQNNKQQNYGLTWTHIFNNNIVGEFRYGLGLRNTLVNITAGNDTPIVRFTNPDPVVSGTIIGNAGSFPIQRYQTDNQFVYNLSWIIGGNHFVKLGTDIRHQKLDDLADSNSRGSWNFTGVCNGSTQFRDPNANNNLSGWLQLINGCVTTFTKGYGPFFLRNRIGESNFYAEDNWKVARNLTLNLGVRYEYVQAPKEVDDLLEYTFKADTNNWEPRLGFAWSPDFKGGFLNSLFGDLGNSSIRAGYGIYHGRLFQSIFSQNGATVRFNPPNAFTYTRTGAATSDYNPFNLADPTNGFTFTPGVAPTARAALTIIDPALEMPYTQQWNVTFERQLPWASALRLSYTGNRGIGLLKYTMQNLPQHTGGPIVVANHPFNGALAGQTLTPAADLFCAGTTVANALCPVTPIGPLEYSRVVPRTNERRPNPLYTTNLEVSNGAWSYYNAMQAEWTKRLTNNLNFQAAYTWSKAIDTTSEATFVGTGDSNILGPDAKAQRGYSRFHTPHRFTLFGTYRSPFFDKDRSILGHILGGWEASMVFKWAHGTPFTVSGTALDLNLDGFSENRPVLVDPSVLGRSIDNPATSQQELPQSAFRSPTSPSDYNCCILGRNTFFVDGIKNVDFGFTKRFLLPWEGHSFVIRADMFNAFNHVQWGFPNATYTSTSLGTLTALASQYASRNVQVSLKYSF